MINENRYQSNAATTRTDIAGRTVSVTDAAGKTTSTAYNPYFDQPSVVTDACGKTACYKYDIRGRKVAEWGTAIQPACFGYDDADRMTSLATFRAGTETITTDPSSRTDGDVTTWAYHATTGLEVSKTYADGKGTVKTYDAFNRLSTETDAREKVKTCSYEHARGLLLGITYSDSTTAESFVYNHLGHLTQVTDDAGVRSIGYNAYGEQETDSLLAEGVTHLVTETRDSFGRSTGYTYTKGDATQQTVTTAYGTDGRISGAGFIHGGQEKQFGYTYLQGTHLLQTLTKPNGMTLTQTYDQHRDLLTQMDYKRGNTLVARRSYQYDTLGRPTSRTLARQGATRNDVFTYNDRSEIISDVVDGTGLNGWDYDNIGNRLLQQQGSACDTYTSNQLNQYTAIEDESHDVFTPTYDDDGNQTRIKTSTGIWNVTYNAKNRPVLFTKDDNSVSVACTYDYMGRRATKVVTENGQITSSHRFLYRGYLQIACCDRKRSTHPCLWLITWDPTQPIATRPLAIQKDGTWYTYGWDLTKNVWEVYGSTGYIRTNYSYTPYGEVTISGDITQPIQWSSEVFDSELSISYFNFRYYLPNIGMWNSRDRLHEAISKNVYYYINPIHENDVLGRINLKFEKCDNYPISKESLKEIMQKAESMLLSKINALTEKSARKDKKYEKCFGKFSKRRFNHVKNVLNQIKHILQKATITIDCCTCIESEDPRGFAEVYRNDGEYKIFLCEDFSSAPNDSSFHGQASAFLHELSHEIQINPTDDLRNPWLEQGVPADVVGPYGKKYVEWIAERDAWTAVYNADNYSAYLSE